MSVSLNVLLVASAALFAIGCFALIAKRSVVVMLMGTQFMLTAGGLALVAFANFGLGTQHRENGPALAVFVAVIAVCELAVGLAMAAMIYREHRTFLTDEYESVGG
ncbi:MAG TPA: NADH-quinone oxidoreductase subunit NuoK [Candidatus Dormibacteraeota bacterium]|jgi:NADH-quinone oxidoreductase subunit K/NAD(P)H-quinone oxidoreductase subunit 4L